MPRQLFLYLVVGGLTVLVDIGLLALLHEVYGVSLGLATTVAFCAAVTMNFLLNRTAMSSPGSQGLMQHALRYGSLVAANYVITLAVVTTAGHVGDRYLVAKVAVVAASTVWNFLLYRHWVFTPPRPASSQRDRVPWFGRSPQHRGGGSVQPNRQILQPVRAYDDEGPVGIPGDRDSRQGRPGGSGATGEHDPGHQHRA